MTEFSLLLFFFSDCATSPQYTRRTFRCFCPNVSRATLVLNDHLNREEGLCHVRDESPGFVTLSRFQPLDRFIPLGWPGPSRDFPQITKICLPTLTFLAQQISIILMKSGRGSCAKFVRTARTGGGGGGRYSCICSLQCARANGFPCRFYEERTVMILGVYNFQSKHWIQPHY